MTIGSEWWWGEDLNLRRHRRQIYSLFPLAAREPHPNMIRPSWSQRRDSNPRPTDYKSVALPAELRWHSCTHRSYFRSGMLISKKDRSIYQRRMKKSSFFFLYLLSRLQIVIRLDRASVFRIMRPIWLSLRAQSNPMTSCHDMVKSDFFQGSFSQCNPFLNPSSALIAP